MMFNKIAISACKFPPARHEAAIEAPMGLPMTNFQTHVRKWELIHSTRGAMHCSIAWVDSKLNITIQTLRLQHGFYVGYWNVPLVYFMLQSCHKYV